MIFSSKALIGRYFKYQNLKYAVGQSEFLMEKIVIKGAVCRKKVLTNQKAIFLQKKKDVLKAPFRFQKNDVRTC